MKRTNLRVLRQQFWGVMAVMAMLGGNVQADVATLKNGMTLDGSWSTISSVGSDPLKPVGETGLKQIVVIDNQLTRTFFPTKQIAKEFTQPPAVAMERIRLPQRIPSSGQSVSVVGLPLRIDPFDQFGHRTFSMLGPKGKPIDIVQGITEITPKWTKVEAIEGINHYIWTMKVATSSIPREQLSQILKHALDPKDPTQRLRIVRLYLQSERFRDARIELEQLIAEFPDLAHLKDQVKDLERLSAERLLKEIELRREAGQFRLVTTMLEQFPTANVPGEVLLKVRETLDRIHGQQQQASKLLKLLDDHVAALKSETNRAAVQTILAEIKSELNINNLDRLADYLRLADDPKMPIEQKLSLAISGWLLGSGAAIDNLAVSLSLVEVRKLVQEYLLTTREPERSNILSLLSSQEAATHPLITALLRHMKPAVPTELPDLPPPDVGKVADVLALPSPPAGKPGGDESVPPMTVAQPGNATGLFELSVASGLSEDPQLKYWVQLPPEYDPYRRYPCIVTLNGGTTPLQQIDWWAGTYNADAQTRYGQATRHGYIVIAPQWQRPHQRQYEYSAREHAAVLLPLRDACKRFAIDVDRVFLTGHSRGGTAAWDIGLAHPDLWAGIMPLVATPGKYITASKYWENGKYVPMYFVCGEKDASKWASAGDFDTYLTRIGFDVMVVEYLGRGHEAFFDEIQNLFAWMDTHSRDFFPKEFKVNSLRPWDNFFWWVETGDPKPISVILPAEWGDTNVAAKTPRPARTETSLLAPNGVSVNSGSCGKVRVWLSPEIVKFDDSLKVVINGKTQKKVQPSLQVLLDDVRTRGDRQHPFWAKVELNSTRPADN